MLLLGPAAWANTEKGQKNRLAAGAIVIGVGLGLLCDFVWPGLLAFITDSVTRAWIAFAGIPVIMLILVFFLNGLRRNMR